MLLLRRPQDVHCSGLWSFPGGKLEVGEDALHAARRELLEETGLSGNDWRLLGEHHYCYPDRKLHFTVFSCLADNLTTLCCADECCWVNRETIVGYPMPEANAALLPLLLLAE